MLLPDERADQMGAMLSAELFRATLAALLLAQPASQLLTLEEPTNNLDMPSTRQLAGAQVAYRGALIVASHDQPFLRTLGATRWLRLDRALTEIDARNLARPRAVDGAGNARIAGPAP
jgi:ATPase subunit of ABC transporter with duplicated ATPase domains